MAAPAAEHQAITSDADVVRVRQLVRTACVELGFGLVDSTKFVTAASEIARNAIEHGGGGRVRIERVEQGERRGIRLLFEDDGPGIADVERALQDGFTTGRGLGLGLGGATRLVNEFHVETGPGIGTRVTLARWK